MQYVEQLQVDIAVTAFGWHVSSENADLSCSEQFDCETSSGTKKCVTVAHDRDKAQDFFDAALAEGLEAYRTEPLVDPSGAVGTRVLWVFSAGNSALNLADENIVQVPAELVQQVTNGDGAARALIVGATTLPGFGTPRTNADYSNYGAPVVNLWAPGAGYSSTIPGRGIDAFGGTSAAAPVIAGTAALQVALRPGLSGQPDVLATGLHATASVMSIRVGKCGVVDADQPFLDAAAALGP